jgi:hypothetical protein
MRNGYILEFPIFLGDISALRACKRRKIGGDCGWAGKLRCTGRFMIVVGDSFVV